MIEKIDLRVDGMTCAGCSGRIERLLNQMPGVTAQVSLIEHRAHVSGLTADAAIAAIRRAGYDAWPIDPHKAHFVSGGKTTPVIEQFRHWITGLALIPMLIEMAAMLTGHHGLVPPYLQLLLATLMQTIVAWPFYTSALRALRAGSANMETLVSLGTLAAYGWSVWAMFALTGAAQGVGADGHPVLYFEASVVVLAMVRIGRWLENRARHKALEVLEGLIHLDQEPVETWQPEPQKWWRIAPQEIAVGSTVRIQANQAIALDGLIISGQTEIDESTFTGESLPAARGPGDPVVAGCLNLGGVIEVKTTAIFSESRRAKIGAQILSALTTRAPIAAMADRIAAVFVPIVLVIAALTAITHFWLGHGVQLSIQYAVAVLVVACPCALGLATPAAIAAGLARAAQHGWLFRSADALQRAAGIDRVVFDKTGTLTSGRPQIIDIEAADLAADLTADSNDQSVNQLTTDSTKSPATNQIMGTWPDWLAAAAAAERTVEHPLAGALLSYAAGRPIPETSLVQNFPGQGVVATLAKTNDTVVVGKPAWVAKKTGPTKDQAEIQNKDKLTAHDAASVVDIAINGQWQGRLWIADCLRPDAKATIDALNQKGIALSILSGDRSSAVRQVAQTLGGLPFLAEQSPEQKTQQLLTWRQNGANVAMVGDGLNDAAAMSQARLGIAMASGAGLTLQTADLTLATGNSMIAVAQSLLLAKAVMRRVKENLVFAFGFNMLAIPLAAMGHLSPVVAGTAMAASSAAVMINATRLLRWKAGGGAP